MKLNTLFDHETAKLFFDALRIKMISRARQT